MEGFHLQQFYYIVFWLKIYKNEVLLRLDFINTVWQIYIVPGNLRPGGSHQFRALSGIYIGMCAKHRHVEDEINNCHANAPNYSLTTPTNESDIMKFL